MAVSIYVMFYIRDAYTRDDEAYTVEVNIIDCDNPDEVVAEGLLEFNECEDIQVTTNDLKLESVQIYTSNNNINSLEGGVDWKDLYVGNYSHIKDFVDLPDDNDRVVALYLHIEEGLALDIACGEAKGREHRLYKNEGEVVDEFVDMERISPRVAKMIDAEKILDMYYPNRFRLPDGKVVAKLE